MIAPPNARRERAQFPSPTAPPKDDEGLITWDWVDEQIATSRNYWICSVNPDNTPHARPLWGVYLDGALYFDGIFKSRWFRNLKDNPAMTVHLENGSDAVIIEGRAEITEGIELAERIAKAYAVKYPPYTPDPDPGGFVLIPQKVFAWQGGNIKDTATRWIFDMK
jgi:general stress protein 26